MTREVGYVEDVLLTAHCMDLAEEVWRTEYFCDWIISSAGAVVHPLESCYNNRPPNYEFQFRFCDLTRQRRGWKIDAFHSFGN